jgi:hypothetical protein
LSAGFTVAPESERVLEAGPYLAGVVELGVILLALGIAARGARAALLPGWSGAPAWLAELILGLTALILLSELLGTFGAFGEAELIAASIVLAVLAVAAGGRYAARRRLEGPPSPPIPPQGSIATTLAVIGCAAVVAGWVVPTLASLAGGMDRADTLWYHMPLSARFVQTGSLGEIFFFDPIFFASFYPANSEVLHAVPILAFDRDIVSPVLNLGFLAIGLLSSWCIGRPYGVAPQALIGGSVALGAQMLVEFQAGEALNDITGVVFVLAAVAVLVNGYAAGARGSAFAPAQPRFARSFAGTNAEPPASIVAGSATPGGRLAGGSGIREPAGAGPLTPRAETALAGRAIAGGALAIAGLAAGLAAGTKLSFLAPVAALTVGVVAIAPAGRRWRTAWIWSLPLVAAGIYWYVRNTVATGNPIPFISSIGPLDLPAPARDFELRPGFPVVHYWNDFEIWWDWFIPGLNESFGPLWAVTLLASVGGGALALWRGREPALRMLGAMVLFTALAYLFTPLTAAGEEGEPIAFVWNVRYIAPAVAVALAFLPCLPDARAGSGRRAIVLVGLALLLATTVGSLVQWEQGHTKGALAAGLGVLGGAALYAWLRARGWAGPGARRRPLVLASVAVLLAAVAVGWWGQRHYLERRYENTSPTLQLAETLRWARDIRDARIAVSGIRGVFNQFPLYGTDLSNHVQWLGIRGDHDAWLRIPTCEQWRSAVNEGGYTHVVTTYDPFHPGRLTDTKEGLWTREDPAADEILTDGPVSVFEIRGEMDPAGCAGLPDLDPSELNGDSVNLEPLANQPPGTGPLAARLRRALDQG